MIISFITLKISCICLFSFFSIIPLRFITENKTIVNQGSTSDINQPSDESNIYDREWVYVNKNPSILARERELHKKLELNDINSVYIDEILTSNKNMLSSIQIINERIFVPLQFDSGHVICVEFYRKIYYSLKNETKNSIYSIIKYKMPNIYWYGYINLDYSFIRPFSYNSEKYILPDWHDTEVKKWKPIIDEYTAGTYIIPIHL